MNFFRTQLVKASLLALVLATPVAFSTPEVQAVPATPRKEVAQATMVKPKYRQAKKMHHYKKRMRHHKRVVHRRMQPTK